MEEAKGAGKETDRQAHRRTRGLGGMQANWDTCRQPDTHTVRQVNKKVGREKDRQTGRQANRKIGKKV